MADGKSSNTQSPYDEEELEYFKNLLLEKRHEAQVELERLNESLQNQTDAEDADRSSTTHHQGDVASDYEEEETIYTLIERQRTFIKRIDEALQRIENGTYGICQATGEKIAKERLEAVPHTRYTVKAKNRGLAEDS